MGLLAFRSGRLVVCDTYRAHLHALEHIQLQFIGGRRTCFNQIAFIVVKFGDSGFSIGELIAIFGDDFRLASNVANHALSLLLQRVKHQLELLGGCLLIFFDGIYLVTHLHKFFLVLLQFFRVEWLRIRLSTTLSQLSFKKEMRSI